MTSPNIESPPDRALALWAAGFVGRPVTLWPLAGDAGGRRYFRLAGQPLLAMYGPDKAENWAWLLMGSHLKARGLNLPGIRAAHPERGFFLLEDLGDAHLAAALKNGPDEAAHGAYDQTIRLMADFHRRGAEGFKSDWGHQEPVYNAAMVEEKEVGYFLQAFLAGYLRQPESGPETREEATRVSQMVAAEAPATVLIHRDFQSRNVMLVPGTERSSEARRSAATCCYRQATAPSGKNDTFCPITNPVTKPPSPFLIDWQGARLGPGAYDLASLLNDPYVSIPPAWRAEFIELYMEAMGRRDAEKFRRELLFTGAARLMQNLGAYGKLCGEGKNFSQWMLPAAERLAKHFENPILSGWPRLACCARLALNALIDDTRRS